MNITDVTPKSAAKPKRVDREMWVILSLNSSDGDTRTEEHDSHEGAQESWDGYNPSDCCYRPIRMFKITYKENE